ncbi:MAG: TIGR02117 family protein [Gammaproteobacteria bacterium]
MRLQGLMILVVSIIISGCSYEPHVIEHAVETNPIRDRSIYVANHGWHTGLIIPAVSINPSLPFLKPRFGSVPYYEFGWGEEGFYQAEKINFGLVVRAIFWPTDAVMHVVAVPFEPEQYFISSEIMEIKLSANELNSLQIFISNSFDYKGMAKEKMLAHGIYGNSQFYRAMGKYYMTNTCNKWTAKGLKSTGMNISTGFKMTADSVMSYIKQYKTQNKIEPGE